MVLKASNVSKSFGRRMILQDINLEIDAGSQIGITGENGSGKSTLLKLITGDLKPNSGQIRLEGSMGYCPQDCILFSQLTVRENFKYFAAAYGLTKEVTQAKMNHLANHFGFEEYIDQRINRLSGGTKQKVNLCIAMLHDPDILILDEPYLGFDWSTYNKFWAYMRLLVNKGKTVLIVAHLLTNTDQFNQVFEIKNRKIS